MEKDSLSIIVVGASGNLARKKIFPALFSLYCQGFLPEKFNVFGFSRTDLSHEEFRNRIMGNLACRYTPEESCSEKMATFLEACYYQAGKYDSPDSFLDLFQLMKEQEERGNANRMFYLAVPPSVFSAVAGAIGSAGLVQCDAEKPWSRVVVEKPFGKDLESSEELTKELAHIFTESQTYRIDHYLGKEVIQNLMVLRFANLVFEPIWNAKYIDRVCVDWKEDIGVEDRAGYFDDYGIIRDVIQNHLLQVVSLIAMEQPKSIKARDVRDAKVKALSDINPLKISNVFLGQYGEGQGHRGYLQEDGVPKDSVTPTFSAVSLYINNERWKGVPFVVTAGKGLNARVSEVRIHFKDLQENIFCKESGCLPPNELAIRIQPDEGIYLKTVNKEPGLNVKLEETMLDLRYKSVYSAEIPDAYECLLLDVIEGDKGLFIRSDELSAAWRIFSPVLHEIEDRGIAPETYIFGSDRPHELNKIL